MKPLLTLSLLFCFYTATAQKYYHHNVFGGRLALADMITEKLGAEVQIQRRTQDNMSAGNLFSTAYQNSYGLLLNYQLSKGTKFSVSPFTYFETSPLYAKPSDLAKSPVKEYRWVARMENEQKFSFFNYINRYTIEYRSRDVLNNGIYVPNWRFRYMVRIEKPINWQWLNGRQLSFVANDEVMVQYGDAVKNNPNIFDQNRLYAGFNYEVVKNVKLTVGYLYLFQERSSGDEFDNVNTIWTVLTFDNLFSQFKRKH